MQPLCRRCIEVWGELTAHHLLVGIEPLHFLFEHHLLHDWRGDDRTEGELLKLIVRTEGDAWLWRAWTLIVGEGRSMVVVTPQAGIDHEHGVLVAHAVLSGDVDARLISDGHAWKEGGGAPLHAELVEVDGFMYRHELTHPMTGAVQVVDAIFPHGFTGQYVELGTTGAFGEDRRTQTDPTFEYEGVVATHLPREGTQWDGTCDVGGAIEVLTP